MKYNAVRFFCCGNLKKWSLLIFIQLVLCLGICAQELVWEDHYNLEFRKGKKISFVWDEYFPSCSEIDKNEMKDGKHPLRFTAMNFNHLPFVERFRFLTSKHIKFPFQFNICQTIFMPATTDSSIVKIAITSKSRNVKTVKMGVAGFDWLENMIYADSIELGDAVEWTKRTLVCSWLGVKYMKIDVRGSGLAEYDDGSVWLDRIDLTLNNKSINDYPVPNDTCVNKKVELSNERIIPLSFSDVKCFKSIPAFQDPQKSIIAFGECLHGSENLCEAVVQAMKSLIVNNNCKVVLMEKGGCVGLKWDLYIQGLTPDSTFIEIFEEIKQYKESLEGMSEFLKWLREHNKTQIKKVRLFGLDKALNERILVFDYFDLLNGNRRDSAFFSLMKSIPMRDFRTTIKIMQGDSLIRNRMDKRDFEYLVNLLKRSSEEDRYWNDTVNVYDYEYKYRALRDYLMGEWAAWIVEKYLDKGEKVAIYAHCGHIDKLNLFSSRYACVPDYSLGYYLHQRYGNKYYAISVQAGEGTYQKEMAPFGRQQIGQLSKPPFNSFEHSALKTGIDYFFYAVKDVPEDISYFRHIPRITKKSQFRFFAAQSRFDGLMFVRQNEALNNGVKIGGVEGNKFNEERRKKRVAFFENFKIDVTDKQSK